MAGVRTLPLALGLLSLWASSPALRAADDPIEVEPTDDTFLSSEHVGVPAGRGERDEFQIYGKPDHTLFRGLLKFDLKGKPGGVRAAILRLTCWNKSWQANATSFFRAHAVTSAWDQGEASWDQRAGRLPWNHPGGDWDPKPAAGSLLVGPIGGEEEVRYSFDLTALAREWQADPAKNNGVAIMIEKGCPAEMRFRSKEHANALSRPKLLLYYSKMPAKDPSLLSAAEVPPFEPYDPEAPDIKLSGKPDKAKVGDAIEAKYSAIGGKEPYTFAAATWPVPGLTLAGDGALKGKPNRAGTYIFGVACTGGNGKRSTDWQRWVVVDASGKAPPVQRRDVDVPPPKKQDDQKDPAKKDGPDKKDDSGKKKKKPVDDDDE